mmetsp:Transcript_30093/g.50632  ORF Transcript_30093/g.50632 Transcript_30093/m.50632 type:complete len:255 (+) Transcript_30093:62-826(+)
MVRVCIDATATSLGGRAPSSRSRCAQSGPGNRSRVHKLAEGGASPSVQDAGAHVRTCRTLFGRDKTQRVCRRQTSHSSSKSKSSRAGVYAAWESEDKRKEFVDPRWEPFLAKRVAGPSVSSQWISPFAEVGPHGKFFEVMVENVRCLSIGAVLELRCTSANGDPVMKDLCFPMFMNLLAAERLDCHYGCEASWLAPELESLERLHDQNLQHIYVRDMCTEQPEKSAMFQMEDSATGEIKYVDTTYERAMAMALR